MLFLTQSPRLIEGGNLLKGFWVLSQAGNDPAFQLSVSSNPPTQPRHLEKLPPRFGWRNSACKLNKSAWLSYCAVLSKACALTVPGSYQSLEANLQPIKVQDHHIPWQWSADDHYGVSALLKGELKGEISLGRLLCRAAI